MVKRAKRFFARATANQTVGNAALIISAAYLLSRLLGLYRGRLLVSHFGVGPELSAYAAAFRLPDLLFTLLVSGAFAVAFIPVLTGYLQKDDRETAWRVTSSLLNLLVFGTLVGAILIVIFADPLTRLITPGFDTATHNLTVDLTRIMALSPVLFAISSVLGSVQQSFNRFIIFALASVFYNVGIIIGILCFAGQFGVYGAAWGVILGVILQALLQWLGLYGLGFKYQPIISLRLKGVRQTLKLMVPRSIDQGIDQIHYSIETVIGSIISPKAIAQFSLANDLKNVPLVLIGSSISTAVFPRLASNSAKGDREKLIQTYVSTARLILFLAIPAAIFAVITRGYIVRLLYGYGDAETANTLGWFAGMIVFTSLFLLVSRVYYALQDTRTPLYLSLASIPFSIILSYIMAQKYGVAGLSMSASIASAIETTILMVLLRRREGSFGEGEILRGASSMAIAAAIMAPTLYLVTTRFLPLYASDKGFIVLAPKFTVIVLIGLAAYLIPCYLLQVKELKMFINRFKLLILRSLNLT